MLRIIISLLLISLIYCEDFKVLRIDSGQVKGVKQESIYTNKEFYSFRGIPYAKSPTGDLRFELPQKTESWTGVKEALQTGLDCLQERHYFGEAKYAETGEDCLFINVYTPDLTLSKNLSVMVFIHGGGYQEGSGSEAFYGPDFLMNEDVILVTFNYRLGPFGFLSLDYPNVPKNVALKDQQFALKWIYDNIHNFGGDKSKVTIFGQSVGGAFVHFHSLSIESRNYFQRAILQSGMATDCNWAYAEREYNHEDMMFKFAQNMGQNFTTIKNLVIFLKTVDARTLFEQTKSIPWTTISGKKKSVLPFRPIIEDVDSKGAFLTTTPELSVHNKDLNIDMMIGYTTQEFLTMNPETNDHSLLPKFFDDFEFLLPKFGFNFPTDSVQFKEMSAKVKEFYFPNGTTNISIETILQYNDLISDTVFAYPAELAARYNSKNENVKTFFYRFGVDDSLNFAKRSSGIKIGGVGHLDEICYIFKCNELNSVYENLSADSTAVKTIQTMANLWANFAKYGNPTKGTEVQWKAFTSNEPTYFYIMNDGVSNHLNSSILAYESNKRFEFWDNLFQAFPHFSKY